MASWQFAASGLRQSLWRARKQQKQTHKNEVDCSGRRCDDEAAYVTARQVESDSALKSTNGVSEPRECQNNAHKGATAERRSQRTRGNE
jgi:hypothetical protein